MLEKIEEKAKGLALRRLSKREYSASEILKYLLTKQVTEEVASKVVADFVSKKFIDDFRYGALWARFYYERGKGPRYIQSKLRERGVDFEIEKIQLILAQNGSQSELDKAFEVLERRYPDAFKDRAASTRAYQGLVRRGFSFEVARGALDRLSRATPK